MRGFPDSRTLPPARRRRDVGRIAREENGDETREMAGGPPEGKGDHGASSSGAGPSSNDTNDHQNGDGVAQQDQQTVSVVGGDMYSVGFIMILLILGMMKAAANRCTC